MHELLSKRNVFPSNSHVWGTGKLNEYINYCKSASLPNTNISFSKSSVTAYVGRKCTADENIKFTAGDSANTVIIRVPSGITLHNVSTGANVTNGNAMIKSGQSFYICPIK